MQKNIADKDTRIKELEGKIEELKSRSENQIEELEENYRNILDSKDEEISELKREKTSLILIINPSKLKKMNSKRSSRIKISRSYNQNTIL